ncbi:MAG: serine acetyltransferase [Bacteroidetes bacterium]|nr:serine acetyltransferase [Bacteroidota bacterium]NCQ12192.1 serine acetyltransferase [Bacteroidota bacterium]
MTHQIYKYLDFCFKTNFIDAPKIDKKDLDYYIEIAIKQSLIDFNIKFKNKNCTFYEKDVLSLIQSDPTLESVFYYRLERQLFLNNKENPLLGYLASLMKRRTGSEIYYSTEIAKGFNIQHGFDIVIGPRYLIGENFTIHQGVTLGQKNLNSPDEKITIGNSVTIFAGAKILGNITIGDNSMVAANAVIISDIEPNSIYGGIPGKRLK